MSGKGAEALSGCSWAVHGLHVCIGRVYITMDSEPMGVAKTFSIRAGGLMDVQPSSIAALQAYQRLSCCPSAVEMRLGLCSIRPWPNRTSLATGMR